MVGLLSLALVPPVLGPAPARAADSEPGWFDVNRATSDSTSYVSIVGDDDEYVTDGTQRLWRSDQTIEVGGRADRRVVVRVGGDDHRGYRFLFTPPAGEALTVGDYRVGGVGTAGMSVRSDHRGCNEGEGSFTVHDITPDLSRVWLSYEFACEDEVATLRGEIRIDAPPTEPLTVTPGALRWKASPPGRDYSTQRVFAVNHGDEPIVLAAPEVSGDAFSVAATTCRELLPGASCAIDVAFDPLTRGTEDGLLRVPTSAGATPLVDVPLSGVGNVGLTHVYSRTVAPDGRTFDSVMTSDVGVFRARADADSVTIGFPDPDRIGERANGRVAHDHVSFAAAPGDVLEVGRTYPGTCHDPGGAILSLPDNCEGEAETGSFTVDELELRPDGSLARLRVRAELTTVEGPALVSTATTVAWQAEEDATPYRPFLTLSGPSDVARPGEVELSALYPTGHGIDTIDLYALTPAGRVLVGSGRATHDAGRADVRARVDDDTVLVAEGTTRDGVVVASEPVTVTVDDPAGPATDAATPPARRTVSLALRRAHQPHAARGRTHVRSVTELRLRPREAGQCLRLQVQLRRDGRWVPRSTSACRRTNHHGTATAVLVAERGTVLRARAVWSTARRAVRAASPWRTLRASS